jgi:hypothetical protein
MNYQSMPFGKFKGIRIVEIPTNYLCYAVEEFELPIELENAIKFEVSVRLDLQPIESNNVTEQDFKNIYRKLSVKYHPDRGGSEIEMKVLNEFKDLFFNKKPF